jgi:hypothetical protein
MRAGHEESVHVEQQLRHDSALCGTGASVVACSARAARMRERTPLGLPVEPEV